MSINPAYTLHNIIQCKRIDPAMIHVALSATIQQLLAKIENNKESIQALTHDLYDVTNTDIEQIKEQRDRFSEDLCSLKQRVSFLEYTVNQPKTKLMRKLKSLYNTYIYPHTRKGIYNRGYNDAIQNLTNRRL